MKTRYTIIYLQLFVVELHIRELLLCFVGEDNQSKIYTIIYTIIYLQLFIVELHIRELLLCFVGEDNQ